MTMKGTLKILNWRELEFTGTIVTKISFINSGKPYARNGTFLLKALGKRKYWRMQNMTEPGVNKYYSGVIADYFDIYFQELKKHKKHQ